MGFNDHREILRITGSPNVTNMTSDFLKRVIDSDYVPLQALFNSFV